MRLMQRLTFPFPFVHHQSHDWKVEQLLTVETRTLLRESSAAVKILSLVSRFPFMKSLVAGSLSLSHARAREEREEHEAPIILSSSPAPRPLKEKKAGDMLMIG
jgi:hypothetical protein